jgi:hypothetical protein
MNEVRAVELSSNITDYLSFWSSSLTLIQVVAMSRLIGSTSRSLVCIEKASRQGSGGIRRRLLLCIATRT